jgi:hypothetical protein
MAKTKFGWPVIALFLVCCSANAQQADSNTSSGNRQSVSLPAPAGWVLYPAPAADSPDLRCANASRHEWQVSLKNDEVKISPGSARQTGESLPFKINLEKVGPWLGWVRHVKRVSDGWLVGFNNGEFGGGLLWFSVDGLKHKELARDNVVGFADSSLGVLVLVGLAHLGMDHGKVLQVGEGNEGERQVKVIADLNECPYTFATETPNSVLVVTTKRLVRVLTTGKIEELLSTNYTHLYPNSMTLSKAGTIHVGMRHFVTRLTPMNGGYKEEWFVPVDCRQFTMREHNCLCLRQ